MVKNGFKILYSFFEKIFAVVVVVAAALVVLTEKLLLSIFYS